jgi:hypothetical protein
VIDLFFSLGFAVHP